MILTGSEIRRNVTLGRITIDPFVPQQLNPNSYNYRLGDSYIELDNTKTVDFYEEDYHHKLKKIPSNGLMLKKGHVYLCNTYERIGSENYVVSLIGKSSMGRLGMFLQLSADLGHQGEIHNWTLEIRPIIPIVIYPYMIIGQVTFWKVLGKKTNSVGYYKDFDLPTISKGLNNGIDRK